DANPINAEALLEPLANGQKRCDIGRIAGPHLTTNRPALIVDHRSDHHLNKIGPMALAESSLTDALSATALEVNRGGIEKDQIQIRKQVATIRKQELFNQILVAARQNDGGVVRPADLLPQKTHGAVQMMKVQPFDAVDDVIAAPAAAKTVRSGNHQPVQHREKNGAFNIEFIF
ncbi:hypothetical protein MRX98_21890, partial [Desulfatitalea sp. M08but]